MSHGLPGTLSRPQALFVSLPEHGLVAAARGGLWAGILKPRRLLGWPCTSHQHLDLDLAPDLQGDTAVSFSGWQGRVGVGEAQTLEIQS